jgi:hypothetical protein
MVSVGDSRSVGSPALETGRYLHAACTKPKSSVKAPSCRFAPIPFAPTKAPIGFYKGNPSFRPRPSECVIDAGLATNPGASSTLKTV